MLITLIPKDQPGAKGQTWRVIDKMATVLFSDLTGPWWLIVPQGAAPTDSSIKWVHAYFDARFKCLPGAAD